MRMLSIVALTVLGVGTLGAQQPAPPPKPAPTPRPAPKLAPSHPLKDWDFPTLDPVRVDEMREMAEELRAKMKADVRFQLDALPLELPRFELALPYLDMARADAIRLRAEEMGAEIAAQVEPVEIQRMAQEASALALDQAKVWKLQDELSALKFAKMRPEQGTPEDSLYRSAREALNRGEYGRAATLFQTMEQKFPRSRFAPMASYYRSFALYRSGSTENLRAALEALRAMQEKYPEPAADPDVGALRTRVYAALAARGDANAASALRAATSSGQSCDEEDMSVRAEALNALTQLDPENANAALKRVLARRDDCSVPLRRRAVYLIGRSGTEQSVNDLLDVAKNDPDASVQSDAISQLGRSSFASVNSQVLLQLFNSAGEERTRQAVLSALRSRGGAESRAVLRSIIERSDLPERMRSQAISQLVNSSASYTWSTSSRTPTPSGQAVSRSVNSELGLEEEDAAFLRSLYPKTDSRTIKSAIISALGRSGGSTNDQWLMNLVKSSSEESSLRREALSRIRSLSVEDLGRLYDALTEREFRNTIVNQLASNEENKATDKLIEIAKTSTDPSVRRQAVQALYRRKDDPKAVAYLRELVERP